VRLTAPIRSAGVALCLLVAPAALAADDGVRRFAIIVGNDEGGRDTRPLMYAQDDARKIHDILLRLGGVRGEDASLVLNGDADDLLTALSATEKRLQASRAAGQRTAVVLYYSGHAKDGQLRLGSSQVPMDSLKARLSQAPADIRLAIFDACRSGVLTRTKGARRAPEFEVRSEGGREAKGMVILTSSASDEDSQESDLLRGSYFSHHLASALLGDADRSGDGRITLSEAYAYAYQRTVADTADSAAGAQHPTFSYDLAGNGDLVLTDVGSRAEGLVFAPNMPGGTWFVVDQRGFIAAEVVKPDNEERRIALAPGRYRLKRRLADRLQIAEVSVSGGSSTLVSPAALRDAPFSDDPVKGVYRRFVGEDRYALALSAGFQSFLDAPTRTSLFPPVALFGLELELRGFLRPDWLWSFDVLFGMVNTPQIISRTPINVRFTELNAGTTIGVEWPFGNVRALVGARATALWMTRAFTGEGLQLPTQTFLTFSPGLVLGARYNLGAVSFQARGRLHYLFYNLDVNQSRSLGYWELGGVFAYEL
jgi:hypothetical protein